MLSANPASNKQMLRGLRPKGNAGKAAYGMAMANAAQSKMNQQAAAANQQANYQAEMLHKGEQLGYGGMLEGLRQANATRQLQGIQQGNAYRDMMGQHNFNIDQTRYTNPSSMVNALFR